MDAYGSLGQEQKEVSCKDDGSSADSGEPTVLRPLSIPTLKNWSIKGNVQTASLRFQEGRQQLFEDYIKNGCSFEALKLTFERRLEETQKTKLRYGFRN